MRRIANNRACTPVRSIPCHSGQISTVCQAAVRPRHRAPAHSNPITGRIMIMAVCPLTGDPSPSVADPRRAVLSVTCPRATAGHRAAQADDPGKQTNHPTTGSQGSISEQS